MNKTCAPTGWRLSAACAAVLSMLGGCGGVPTVNGFPIWTQLPTDVPDGVHMRRLETPDSALEIDGQWKGSVPEGPATIRVFQGLTTPKKAVASCTGVLRTTRTQHPNGVVVLLVMDDGEVKRGDGSVMFRGNVESNPALANGCVTIARDRSVKRIGTYFAPGGWSIASEDFHLFEWLSPEMLRFRQGQFKEADGRPYDRFRLGQPERVIFRSGRCQIRSPAGDLWDGSCDVPEATKRTHVVVQKATEKGIPNFSASANVRWIEGVAVRVDTDYTAPELRAGSKPMIWIGPMSLSGFALANGEGVLQYANGDKLSAHFDMGLPTDGVATLTEKSGAVWRVAIADGKPGAMRHPAPQTLQATGQECGFPGWRLLKGSCDAGRWSGDVEAYSANGNGRIVGSFDKNQPRGEITWSNVADQTSLRGTMVYEAGNLGFVKGRAFVRDAQVYEGPLAGYEPRGAGLCRHEGASEACEYANGERVDSLYKMRLENERLRIEQARRDREARLAAAEQARQQALRQQAELAAAQALQAQQANSGGFLSSLAGTALNYIPGGGSMVKDMVRREVVKAGVQALTGPGSTPAAAPVMAAGPTPPVPVAGADDTLPKASVPVRFAGHLHGAVTTAAVSVAALQR